MNGITVEEVTECTVREITVKGCKAAGLELWGCQNAAVLDCQVSGNGKCGIYISEGSANCTLTGNRCVGEKKGIWVKGCYTSITGNTVTGSETGIYTSTGAKALALSGNVLIDNETGIELAGTSGTVVVGNMCCRGTGNPGDYTEAQYTMKLLGTENTGNLITGNSMMGKEVVSEGGTGNTVINNKYS